MKLSYNLTEKWQNRIEQLIEALELPTAKEYTKIGKDAREDAITGLIFKNVLDPIWEKIKSQETFQHRSKDRAYFNFSVEENVSGVEAIIRSDVFEPLAVLLQLTSALYDFPPEQREELNYLVNEEFETLVRQYKDDVPHWRSRYLTTGILDLGTPGGSSNSFFDIKTGIVTFKGRNFKVAKFFDKCFKDGMIPERYKGNVARTLQDYNRMKSNIGGITAKEYLIVISRHPVDVAGMSTDRGWRSCMMVGTKADPKNRAYSEHVECDVKEGTLIAYLIDKKDLNINAPVGRVLLKPLYNATRDKVYYTVERKTYGTVPDDFLQKIKEIMEDVQPYSGLKADIYALPDTLYREDPDDDYLVAKSAHITVTPSILRDILAGRISDLFHYDFPSDLDLTGLDFRKAKISGQDLSDLNLQGVNFKGANLQGVKFKGTGLQGARFQGADLEDAYFRGRKNKGAELRGIDFQGANLTYTYMSQAELQGADFRGATLHGTRLGEANLQGAKFQGADLTGARFYETKLQGAKFQGADLTGIDYLETCTGLDTIEYDEATIWPAGFDIHKYQK